MNGSSNQTHGAELQLLSEGVTTMDSTNGGSGNSGSGNSGSGSSNSGNAGSSDNGGDAADTAVPAINDIDLGTDYQDITADIKILTNRTDIVDTVYKGYAEQFHELYPNITVTYEGIIDYEESLRLRLTTGDWGDICFIPTSVQKSQLADYFIPMPQGYETETDRVRKRLKETLTPGEKLANWWFYLKRHVLLAAAAALIGLYFALQSWGKVPADYTVGWVSGMELDAGTAETVAGRLARFGQDLNGDGKVHVDLHQIVIDLGAVMDRGGSIEGQKEQGNVMALEADLNIFQSGVFLTDDPAALQAYTGALLYRDGTQPEPGAENLENIALAWEQCPWLGEPPVERPIYLTVRGCWNEDQREQWDQSWAFWQALQAGETTQTEETAK